MRFHRSILAIAGLLPYAMLAGQPAAQADAETPLWTRDRLGGDLFGVRPALTEHGVDILLETTGFYPPAGGAPAPVKEGDSWQINYIFEQFLCQHPDNPAKGWGIYGLLGVSDGNPNPIRFSAALGLGAKGVCAARPDDNFGVGFFCNGVSDELKDTLALANIPIDDEYGMEIYYDAAVTPWFRLGADLQVANPVLERRETAVTLGLRGRLIF